MFPALCMHYIEILLIIIKKKPIESIDIKKILNIFGEQNLTIGSPQLKHRVDSQQLTIDVET